MGAAGVCLVYREQPRRRARGRPTRLTTVECGHASTLERRRYPPLSDREETGGCDFRVGEIIAELRAPSSSSLLRKNGAPLPGLALELPEEALVWNDARTEPQH